MAHQFLIKRVKQLQLPVKSREELETSLLLSITNVTASRLVTSIGVELKKCKSWEEKLNIFMDRVPIEELEISIEQRKHICTCIYKRLLAIDSYDVSTFPPIKSSISLLKASMPMVKNFPEDYELSKMTTGKIECHVINGNHLTILDNPMLIKVINETLLDDVINTKMTRQQEGKIN